jgi:predicted transcriptional regulator of viral defense system
MTSITRQKASEILLGMGTFRASQALEAGISQPMLSRLASSGVITRLAHGIYIHSEGAFGVEQGFSEACARVGLESAIGGLSALFYYGLCEQVPTQTWLVVPSNFRSKHPRFRILHSKLGTEREVDVNDGWRIVSVERSIIEAFVYHTKMGYQTALVAARCAIREAKASPESIYSASARLGVWPLIAKSWEAITTP